MIGETKKDYISKTGGGGEVWYGESYTKVWENQGNGKFPQENGKTVYNGRVLCKP